MLKRTLKIFTWILGVNFGLLCVTLLVVWLVNLHDQPPSQIVLGFESDYRNRPQVPEQANAFVYLMGFSVAQNENPAVIGAKRIELINEVINGKRGDIDNNPLMHDEELAHERSAAVKAITEACRTVFNKTCSDALEQGNDSIGLWKDSEQLLYKRYLHLLEYSAYQESLLTDINMPLPAYGDVIDGQKLFLAHLYVLAKQGDAQPVKELLDKDIVYWRIALASSDSLISKMIAVSAIKRHFMMGNFILRKLYETTNHSAVPQSWFEPLSSSELSILPSFRNEWLSIDKMVKNLKKGIGYVQGEGYVEVDKTWSDFWTILVLQPQDSSNKHAQNLKILIDCFNVPLDQYPNAVVNVKNHSAASLQNAYKIYNFIGTMLVNIALPAYSDYAVRIADLEGVRQAAVLTSDLRSQALTAEAIPDYIARSAYHNPYILKPFEWDAESKAVKFTGLEEGERGAYLLPY